MTDKILITTLLKVCLENVDNFFKYMFFSNCDSIWEFEQSIIIFNPVCTVKKKENKLWTL